MAKRVVKKLNKDAKQKLITGVALLVVFLLVVSSVYVYYEYFEEKEVSKEEAPKKVDNRISPLENQGLILEVLRIRHRGLAEKLLKRGTSWRNTPSFYFISEMDGVKYISKDVEGGTVNKKSVEILFNTWDTIFMENEVFRDAKEEQTTSDVTLTIVERTKTGLFGRKTKDTEKDKIHVTYNYSTGRWYGDDTLKDEDGYGHYLGETFEVWFNIYQTDFDGDGIPYWTEVNLLGTDPRVDDSKLDPDNDGIPTAWEWKWGYDPFTWDDHKNLDPDVDGIENVEEYQMAKWFADPFSQDIYIETDGMEKGKLLDVEHVLWEESKQAVIERFSEHNINVYIDDGWIDGPKNGGGEILPAYERLSQDSGMMLQYYRHHFADERKGIFRYLLVAIKSGFCHPSEFNRYDTMTVATGLSSMLKIRKAFTPRTQRLTLASVTMHEIGHSIGISSWSFEGCDNTSYAASKAAEKQFLNKWGNYFSVMNYYYIYNKNLMDYSDGTHGENDQNDWLKVYLPAFQIEDRVFEEAYFEPPAIEKIVNETLELELKDWKYDQQLSEKFTKTLDSWSPVKPIKTKWFVLVKTDEAKQSSARNIRVYAQPQIMPGYAEWTLSYEGTLDANGNMQFYSANGLTQDAV